MAASFTPKSYENTQESGESSVDSPSHREKKFLFSPKDSDGNRLEIPRGEKARSSRSKYLKVREEEDEEDTKSWRSSSRLHRSSRRGSVESPSGGREEGS